jgi:two-component system response regulator
MTTPRHILLVEDNPDDEALTLRAFAKNGIENPVVVARDGLEAVERLFSPNSHGRPPDQKPAVVLLDLKLPRIDGLEVLRRIRAHESTALLPVVILTTSGESRDIHQSYQLGANSYIRKPVDYQHFVEAVGAIVAYWLKLNMPADGY